MNLSSRSSGTTSFVTTARSFHAVWPAWLVLAIVILIRIPFVVLHPLLEDALITFRAARHLAEYGDFSFNLHEHFPGTTSLLYPLILAAFDLISRHAMFALAQVFGIFCVAGACWYLARALCSRPGEQRLAWLLIGCWPIAILVSYIGMETSLLLFVLGMAIFALAREGHATLFAICILLLPLVRPDAVAYALLFTASMFLIDRRAALRGAVGFAAGVLLLLLGNRITTGHFLITTARAKEIAYHPSHALHAIAARAADLFFHQSYLLPTPTSYLVRLGPFVFLLTSLGFAVALWKAEDRRQRITITVLAVASLLVPLAYAYGGVIFAWYLYPANWIATGVAIAVLARLILRSHFPRAGLMAVGIVWLALVCLQWTKALTASTEDYHYRGDIGRYLAAISHGQGTLFLEPAGFIPYYSRLRTDDEVGLVSPSVTPFIERDPAGWWFDYVAANEPEYIVQRQGFDHFTTFEGYTLTPAQQRWFGQHYYLLRRFHYDPALYHASPFLRRILALGAMEDYLVYQRRDVPAGSR